MRTGNGQAPVRAVTVIKSIQPAAVGKRYSLLDGTLKKQALAHVSAGICQTASVPDSHAMVELLTKITRSKDLCIVPGLWGGADEIESFDLVTEDELCKLTGAVKGDVAGGVHLCAFQRSWTPVSG